MNIYTTDKIRNVVLLGHGGSGKTSLAEAFGYLSVLDSFKRQQTTGGTICTVKKNRNVISLSVPP